LAGRRGEKRGPASAFNFSRVRYRPDALEKNFVGKGVGHTLLERETTRQGRKSKGHRLAEKGGGESEA